MTGYLCKRCGAASPVGIGYAGTPDAETPAPGCPGPHACTYDTGSMYGCEPVCDAAATHVVEYRNGTYRGRALVCAAHVRASENRAYPGHIATRALDMPRQARRVNEATARAHFRTGGAVCVSVNGEDSFPVTRSTVTHDRESTTWDELTDTVRGYGDTRQRYYAVTVTLEGVTA